MKRENRDTPAISLSVIKTEKKMHVKWKINVPNINIWNIETPWSQNPFQLLTRLMKYSSSSPALPAILDLKLSQLSRPFLWPNWTYLPPWELMLCPYLALQETCGYIPLTSAQWAGWAESNIRFLLSPPFPSSCLVTWDTRGHGAAKMGSVTSTI